VVAGQLAETVSCGAVAQQGVSVDVERLAAYMAAFEAGPAHAGADPLDVSRGRDARIKRGALHNASGSGFSSSSLSRACLSSCWRITVVSRSSSRTESVAGFEQMALEVIVNGAHLANQVRIHGTTL
jgi:hypothetical protein